MGKILLTISIIFALTLIPCQSKDKHGGKRPLLFCKYSSRTKNRAHNSWVPSAQIEFDELSSKLPKVCVRNLFSLGVGQNRSFVTFQGDEEKNYLGPRKAKNIGVSFCSHQTIYMSYCVKRQQNIRQNHYLATPISWSQFCHFLKGILKKRIEKDYLDLSMYVRTFFDENYLGTEHIMVFIFGNYEITHTLQLDPNDSPNDLI